ncbi:hypothetical protein DFAR_1250002 [Desulfarculales bacterium]
MHAITQFLRRLQANFAYHPGRPE